MTVFPAAFVKRVGAIALLSSAMWTLLGAQQPRAKPGVSWERAREAAGKDRTVLDNSGLVEIDNSLPPNVDAEDLSALCQARERAIEIARAAGASNLSAVGTEQDPVSNERRATAERYLAAISTYVGDVDGAILHFTSARDAIVPWGCRLHRPQAAAARAD